MADPRLAWWRDAQLRAVLPGRQGQRDPRRPLDASDRARDARRRERFDELQRGLPGISRSVLTDRMRALERAEVIERRTGPKGRTLEYRLTSAGRDLEPVVQAIGEWGATWSFTDPRPEELDPDLLIVWMARHVDRQRLPPNRTVVKIDFRDPEAPLLDGASSPPRSQSASSIRVPTSTSRSPSTPPRSTASTWDGPSWAARFEPAS